jgi:GNAT superfamily N-acetyltransferase
MAYVQQWQGERMESVRPGEVRRAGVHDVAEVVRLRQAMFEAMASAGVAARPEEAASTTWQPAAIGELERQFAEQRSAGFAVHAPRPNGGRAVQGAGQLIACAVATLDQRLPGPGFPTGLSGSMHTVFVEAPYRHQGLARLVVSAALAWLSERGAETVDLHATPEAEPLYRSLGFTEPRSAALRWLSSGRDGTDASIASRRSSENTR